MTWEIIAPGTWVIFGIVLFPVYTVFLAWYLGKPRDIKVATMGMAYFTTFVVGLWVNFFLLTMVIRFVFF